MKKQITISKDYVFRKNKQGHLQFIGDFDGFYQNEKDPWGQKGDEKRLKEYYKFSRKNLLQTIKGLAFQGRPVRVMEVGCGLGYVTSFLSKGLGPQFQVIGGDISPTAVDKARQTFSNLSFEVVDITRSGLRINRQQDAVIMSQILWYILEELPDTFINLSRLIKKGGYLIFVNAFLHEQKYGKDTVDGFDGLVRYIHTNHFDQYRIVRAQVDYSGRFIHDDGILVLQKR